jgi:cytidylate kinase
MPGVTITAGYGAGGSLVAPAVAQELGLALLDRAISVEVADRLQVTVAEAQVGETKRSFTDRFFGLLSPLSQGVLGAGTDAAPAEDGPIPDEHAAFREQSESIMRAALDQGAVILGRAGTAAFRAEPEVLRVRLFGPVEARVARAAAHENEQPDVVRRRLRQVDEARDHYIWRLYKVNASDPALFHLQIDSTVVAFADCAQIICTAYRSMISTSDK